MALSCQPMPDRISVGFPTETPCCMPSASKGSHLLSTRKSLLSQLLQEKSPSFGQPQDMDTEDSDAYTLDLEGEEQEEGGHQQHHEAEGMVDDEDVFVSVPHSRPIYIPNVSDGFLRQQREAYKRFVYLKQIEEMRRHCQEYFERKSAWSAFTHETDAAPEARQRSEPQQHPQHLDARRARQPLHQPGF